MFTLPNMITLFRFALIPVFLILFLSPLATLHLLASAVFILAALSDALDGWLARLLEQESSFGRLADPLADKLLSVSIVLALLIRNLPVLNVRWVYGCITTIVVTEVIIATISGISVLRGIEIRPATVGKLKTAFQFLTILCTLILLNAMQDLRLLATDWPWGPFVIQWGFGLSALLTVVTLFVYIARYPGHREQLKVARKEARKRGAKRRERLSEIRLKAPGKPRREEALRVARDIARELSREPGKGESDRP